MEVIKDFLVIYLAVINIIAFLWYGVDKYKARKGKWRISEKALLGLAAIGGALGAWIGMKAFRHKTQHKKFKVLVPAFLVIWCVALVYFFIVKR